MSTTLPTSPRPRLPANPLILSGAALAMVGLAACGSGGESPTPPEVDPPQPVVHLVGVSGGGQGDTVGHQLADSLVVRAELEDGSPFEGMGVSWEVDGPVGRASPSRTHTNVAGLAATSWSLGRTPGVQSLRAIADNGKEVSFGAYANADRPAHVTITPSELPTLGTVGDTAWLKAEVTDHYGNPTLPFEWRSSDSTVATIDPGGVVRVTGSGDAFVVGVADSIADSVSVQVLPFQRVSGGGANICGISAGALHCRGENARGEVGDGTKTERRHFTPIMSGTIVEDVSLGSHTCAVTPGGQAYCWGANSYGQLGGGTLDFETLYESVWPLEVTGGHSWALVRAGMLFTCGLTLGGDVYCWGQNVIGQLGRDTLTDSCANGSTQRCSNTPIPVDSDLDFQAIDANRYGCGLTTSGAAYCWGPNDVGQLGNAGAGVPCGPYDDLLCSWTPVPVDGGHSFTAIAVGSAHACALNDAGEAYCWGMGLNGQLGGGLATISEVPVAVAGGHHFVELSLDYMSCGVTVAGELYCWGPLDQWPIEEAHSPHRMDEASSYVALTVSGRRVCALRVDDTLICLPY